MPNISSFMYAENIQALNVQLPNDSSKTEQKIQIMGPLSVFRPPFIPCTYSFSIASTISDYDHTVSHKLRLVFSKTDIGKILVDSGEAEIPPKHEIDEYLPKHLRGLVFALDFKNVVFESEGAYKTDVFLDGQLVGSIPIEVWRKPI